ncbi:hypothetical protein A6D6_04060 [Alcanivorax xiamenensis]|uniref:Uncharacterized protein n=2 Tax=Alcanivorax xiamenensis TaxID=1177156 RepID=A0ABQ6Y2L8_9GAMM|nr:hypothetical protein A6D6_04060 [Alcanivorax xiamenensis]
MALADQTQDEAYFAKLSAIKTAARLPGAFHSKIQEHCPHNRCHLLRRCSSRQTVSNHGLEILQMMNWIPIVFFTFKIVVFGTGMFFAIKWHYDKGKKKKENNEISGR